MFDVDALIHECALEAQIENGVNSNVLAARNGLGGRGALLLKKMARARAANAKTRGRELHARWTADEEEFVRTHLGVLSEQEIADALGRSRVGVHIHSERVMRLPRPSKNPGVLMTSWIADALGVDRSTPSNWIDAGVLEGRWLPFERPMRVVDRTVFLMWVVNPKNWIYFDARKVKDAYLKRLLELKRARWEDEWWSPGQVARYHGLHPHGAHKQIARRAKSGDGAARWGNHRILKSVAMQIPFFKGKGSVTTLYYGQSADAFLLLAWGCGVPREELARLLTDHWGMRRDEIWIGKTHDVVDDGRAVSYRVRQLLQNDKGRAVCGEFGLKVELGTRVDAVFADWKLYRRRLPALAEAMEKFWMQHKGYAVKLSAREQALVRGVLVRWALRFAGSSQMLPKNRKSADWLERAYERLRERGIDPFLEVGI